MFHFHNHHLKIEAKYSSTNARWKCCNHIVSCNNILENFIAMFLHLETSILKYDNMNYLLNLMTIATA